MHIKKLGGHKRSYQKFSDLFLKYLRNHHWSSSSLRFRRQSLNPLKTTATEQDMTENGALGLVFLRRRSLKTDTSPRSAEVVLEKPAQSWDEDGVCGGSRKFMAEWYDGHGGSGFIYGGRRPRRNQRARTCQRRRRWTCVKLSLVHNFLFLNCRCQTTFVFSQGGKITTGYGLKVIVSRYYTRLLVSF